MTKQKSPEDDMPERQEEIAAAKLLLAVKLYPGHSLPNARSDTEGEADIGRFGPGVWALVLEGHDLPGGPRLKGGIARWLGGGDVDGGSETPLILIKRATKAIGQAGADPEACQKIWAELEKRAR